MSRHHRPRSSRRLRRLAAAALVGAALLATAVPAGADDLDNRRQSTQEKLDAAETQQAELSAALEELEGQAAETGQRLGELQGQMPAAQAAVTAAQAEVDRTQREADQVARRLTAAQQQRTELAATIEQDTDRAAELRATIAQMGRQAYRAGPDMSSLELVMDATSTEDFVAGYSQRNTALRVESQVLEELETLMAENTSAGTRLAAVETKITQLKAEADQKLAEAQVAQAAAEAAQAALEALTAQVADEQASLEAQRGDIEAQLAAADAAAAQLASELAAIIAEQRARPTPPVTPQPSAAPPPAQPGTPGAVFANPTVHRPMVVNSEYGWRLQPVLGYYRLHAGIDLRAYCGEAIYAARAGTVQWARYLSGYGNQVMVDHGWVNGSSLMSSYSHMTQMVVSPGQSVSAGQVVGYAGMTGGVSTGCHLHFETYINGSTVNPRPYLGL